VQKLRIMQIPWRTGIAIAVSVENLRRGEARSLRWETCFALVVRRRSSPLNGQRRLLPLGQAETARICQPWRLGFVSSRSRAEAYHHAGFPRPGSGESNGRRARCFLRQNRTVLSPANYGRLMLKAKALRLRMYAVLVPKETRLAANKERA